MPSLATTTSGRFRGTSADGVHAFKGIPYASAPRFRPPERVHAPEADRDATAYGPSCPQRYLAPEDVTPERLALSELFGIPLLEAQPQDEECLVLNVWTPGLEDGGERPVLVRFHGRGFHGGSGSWAWVDGARLAARGDVVVITLNHRLAVLGHLHLDDRDPAYAGAGNAGVLDLVAALAWVRDNARAFGGDPGNVTIFGESGGGAKVATLLHVPAARGLFHRAIVQSGAGFAPLAAEPAGELAALLLDELGVGVEELAALPVERILEAQLAVATRIGGPQARFQRTPPFRPVLDGTVVTDGPATAVPLMIGTGRHEHTMFLAVEGLAMPGGAFAVDEAGLRERVAPLLGERTEDVLDAYRAADPGLSATDLLVLILSDATFRLPSLALAAAHPAPAYAYLLAWGSPALDGFLRATHGLCVPLTMDTRAAVPMADVPGGERMTELMSETWLAFARSGAPNHAGLPRWEPYDEARRATLVFDLEPALVEDAHGAQRRALAAPAVASR